MIAAHRRRHRWLVVVLGSLSLVTIAAALADRREVPREGALSRFDAGGEAGSGLGEGEALWTREDLFGAWPARVVGYPGGSLEIKPLRPLVRPDVLLYWSPRAAVAQAARLPDDAHLLGRLGGTRVRRFVLPEHGRPAPSARAGALVLYSLGHQEVVARATLPPLDRRGEGGR